MMTIYELHLSETKAEVTLGCYTAAKPVLESKLMQVTLTVHVADEADMSHCC